MTVLAKNIVETSPSLKARSRAVNLRLPRDVELRTSHLLSLLRATKGSKPSMVTLSNVLRLALATGLLELTKVTPSDLVKRLEREGFSRGRSFSSRVGQ